jgi:RNA polymerase primary sigma factor
VFALATAPFLQRVSHGKQSDPTDAAARKIIKAAKKGYITHDQVNAFLSSEECTSDQIEDVFVTLSEMHINVVENDEAETEEADDGKDD